MTGITWFPLNGVACWVCGVPATYAELHPDGGVRTVHAYLDQSLEPHYSWCWSIEHQPLPGGLEPPLMVPPSVEDALERTRARAAAVRARRRSVLGAKSVPNRKSA